MHENQFYEREQMDHPFGRALLGQDGKIPCIVNIYYHSWVRQTLILVTRSTEIILMSLFEMLYRLIFPFHPESYHKSKMLD